MRRELFGIWIHLQAVSETDAFKNARSIRIYSDSKSSIYSLIRGTAKTNECRKQIKKIYEILTSSNKRVQFIWQRRDHRYLRCADALSKRFLQPNPVRPSFQQLFCHWSTYNIVGLHRTFSIHERTSDLASFFPDNQVSLLILPHQVILLERWLRYIHRRTRRDTTFRWICVVPPIWSCKNITKFLTSYARFELPIEQILTRPRFLVKKSSWICACPQLTEL